MFFVSFICNIDQYNKLLKRKQIIQNSLIKVDKKENISIKEEVIFKIHAFEKLKKSNSYFSQVGEDMILSIVFSQKNKGFYVDVGAHDPDEISVTKYFYNKGWNGINIEPQKHFYDLLIKKRPRDINLNAAIDHKQKKVNLYYTEGSTALETTILDQQKHVNTILHDKNLQTEVQAFTLAEILQKYINKTKSEIDFLKIDVEGAEKNVLMSIDFDLYKPKVICIESVEFDSHKKTHHNWEDILLKSGYEYVFFDGLNRYYFDKRHVEIKNSFEVVKNIYNMLGQFK